MTAGCALCALHRNDNLPEIKRKRRKVKSGLEYCLKLTKRWQALNCKYMQKNWWYFIMAENRVGYS